MMTSLLMRKIEAFVLSGALILTAGTALGNDWSKAKSRTRGSVIGAAAGAVLGPPGVIAGAAIGNGVQRARQAHTPHHHHRNYAAHRTHHRRSRA